MPKKDPRHKRDGRTTVTKSATPRAIGELLARSTSVLSQIGDQNARQTFWRSWLSEKLPEDLGAHVTGAVARDGALTLFADSAAWAARLRYALRELQPTISREDPNIQQVRIRVLPANRSV